MKKLTNLIAMAGIACIAAISCQKTPGVATLTAPSLTADPASVVVAPDSEETALTFTWTDVTASGITPIYAFQVTQKGDTEFAAGTAYECDGLKKAFTHDELESLAEEIGASLDEGFTLVARVRVAAKGNSAIAAVFSNTVEVAVSKTQYPIEQLYPIGEATPYGWTIDKSEPMTKNGSIFTWEGHLYANADFKFVLRTDEDDNPWWPGVVNKNSDPFTYEPVLVLEEVPNVDKKFRVAKEGKYTLTVDATNTNAITLDVKFISDDPQDIVVNELYVLGSATKSGWSLDAMESFTKDGDIFTWEGELKDEGEFRFPMQKDWWPCLMVAEDGTTLVKGNSDNDKITYNVDKHAIYKVVCDVKQMKVTITYIKDVEAPKFPTVYMCGDATPYGWTASMSDESQLKPVDASKPNVLSWTGALTSSGTFKFLTTNDWIPSYNRDATASEYWTLVYRESYDQPDEQFKVDTDGNYTVTVDVENVTISCTKQ